VPTRCGFTSRRGRLTGAVGALLTMGLVAGCSAHASHTDEIMHNVASHADMNRATDLASVANELTSSAYLKGSTLTVLSKDELRAATPGVTKTWARFRVRLSDPYAPGAFGQPSTVVKCYELDYSYYGLAHTKHRSCPGQSQH
jgi:hypothetical protein